MPESVAILKKENQALKARIDSLLHTVKQLQAKSWSRFIRLAPTLVLLPMKKLKASNTLVTGLMTLTRFKKEAKKELKQVRAELAKFRTKVNTIAKAIDEICECQLPIHC